MRQKITLFLSNEKNIGFIREVTNKSTVEDTIFFGNFCYSVLAANVNVYQILTKGESGLFTIISPNREKNESFEN